MQGGLRCGGLTPALAPRMPVLPRMYDMYPYYVMLLGSERDHDDDDVQMDL